MIVVADASPLIALARIGRLDLLHTLFGQLLVPEAVWQEVVESGLDKTGAWEVREADWIARRSIVDLGLANLLRHDLGAGESQAIVLAREAKADFVLMDERLGRSAARRLGLRVVGLVGVLIKAREQGLVANASEIMDQLHQQAGFWISADLRKLVTR